MRQNNTQIWEFRNLNERRKLNESQTIDRIIKKEMFEKFKGSQIKKTSEELKCR